ncbi:MAG: 30S ribosomal protein S7 [Candidatus Yanofskybacteria bacterium RIFCSPHIGHO2_01_FULL_45_42]|uniref:Small ribosomal subunit protein uS7 n=3 Tax=Candidatus Yanofskyibacteriota TaxID=1752733 RepID=A0A1F8F6Y2_9BACT|nr:MAG: 30S ribosomal protein S7 [Candidatus Yanofskybacteria bacterium RIFCSPHIGHO2_01_FULL_45_42]OGN16353.1 MAG: 30S ribosomal protein S7 [Candidatus Yanofskybacteria bacterium RIFCSPHIGHO2_02_FULL_46_19]OGN26989.1 MAG: 30S ribosomal protein S7 [Candidatus Yanofskybacteria bacterium RIFCSPLOWO2_01_FULL_45_72]OGN32396.1 MAG: 30S ribosomal protein S7 [Candidatus Yanofskybacteria bacterium RIFCSPLOWO2_02_FULL_45_18]
MRRPVKKRIEINPDIKYSSVLVSKFINKIMIAGKKSIASKIVYGALEDAEKKLQKPSLEILEQAVQNVSPSIQLKSRRVGGANYQIPVEVKPERRLMLAIMWIVGAARSQKGKEMKVRLADEFISAFNNTGNAVKKKLDTHRMAEANKAFAHFAW